MRLASGNTRMKFIAGAVLLCLASTAASATDFAGGGATLPAFGYAGSGTANRLMLPAANSLLKVFSNLHSNVSVTYCQTGSGGGKNVLDHKRTDTSGIVDDASIACVVPSPSTAAIGFSGNQVQPFFVGSDSPMSSAEYSAYDAGHSTIAHHQPFQVPSVSGAISVAFRNDLVSQLNLTEDQVCRIFSGDIKTWNDSRLTSAIVPVTAGVLPTGAIKIVSRADGSGTSFSMSNHLTAKCGTASAVDPTGSKGFHANGAAPNFKTDQSWAVAAASYIPNYSAGSSAQSGNPAVVQFIHDNDATIGYAEAANSNVAGVSVATVKNDVDASAVNPKTYGGTSLAVTYTDDKVITGVDANGRPVVGNLPLTPVVAGCMKLVNPDNYATPAAGYPIIAVSYMLVNRSGNKAAVSGAVSQTTNVRDLIDGITTPTSALRTGTGSNKVSTIGANTGLSFLTPSAASGSTAISTANCVFTET